MFSGERNTETDEKLYKKKRIKMRRKSFPVRSSRKSLDPSPTPASLPDEAHERFGSGVSNTQCGSADSDAEIVPETFDERDVPHKKRRHRLDTCEPDRGGLEKLNLDACIVCEISDNSVCHCSGVDCLLSFHGECLNAEFGSSGDPANTHCPYCWFRILALKSKSLREKAIEAEKAVFKYLDKEMKSRDEVEESVAKTQEDTLVSGDENGNQEHSVDSTDIVSDQELQGEKDDCSSKDEQVQVEKASDISRGENMPFIEKIDQPEDKMIHEVEASEDEERVATENFQDTGDDNDDETAKKQTKVSTGVGKKRDDSPFLSIQESFPENEHNQIQQNEKIRRRRRSRIVLSTVDSEISSNESTNERNGEDVAEQITSSAQVTSPSGKMKNQERKLSATTKVAKSNSTRDMSFFWNNQRRKLFWTPEEEDMLKVGVEKFAAEAKKNMPWRKILEMGEKVFHETRTPADLKDKWRNMIGARSGHKTEH